MKILGIDYGRSKIGLAIAELEALPYPFGVISFRTKESLLKRILGIVNKEGIEKVVIGLSEGKFGKETLRFAKELERSLSVPVIVQDETLTTHDAQKLSIEAGINRRKRKKLEDAYAACLILEKYLEG